MLELPWATTTVRQSLLLRSRVNNKTRPVLVPTRPCPAFYTRRTHHDAATSRLNVEGAEEVVLEADPRRQNPAVWLPDAILDRWFRHADSMGHTRLCARNTGLRVAAKPCRATKEMRFTSERRKRQNCTRTGHLARQTGEAIMRFNSPSRPKNPRMTTR